MNKKNILAVIQARSGSKGIPKKNIFPIGGHPLMSYSIAAANESKLISKIIVSTDSQEFCDVANKYGALTPFMRPKELSGDKVTSVDSLLHAAIEAERIFDERYDFIIELPCVSPLRDASDIDQALELLINSDADAITSYVATGEKHPTRLKKIVNGVAEELCNDFPEPFQISRRQDLMPPAYIRNGAIYAMTRDTLIQNKSRHGNTCLVFEMTDAKSVNIDTEEDLRLAEFKINNGECNNNPFQHLQSEVEVIKHSQSNTWILISTPVHFLPTCKQALCKKYNCIFVNNPSKQKIKEILAEYNISGWICNPCPKFIIDSEILSCSSSLKLICTTSTGSNHINHDDCQKNNVTVSSLKNTDFVKNIKASSEFAFALLLAVVRFLPQSNRSAESFFWRESEDKFRGIELYGKTLGVIGFGRIGSNVSKYALAMGMKVVAYDVEPKKCHQVKFHETFEKVLKESDVILISVHLDQTTSGMVTKTWFDLMKDGAYFVNISRGDIINESDLISALSSKKLTAAGVDVISGENESSIKNSPLIHYARNNANLIVTPHIAGLTYDSEEKAAMYSIGVLEDILDS